MNGISAISLMFNIYCGMWIAVTVVLRWSLCKVCVCLWWWCLFFTLCLLFIFNTLLLFTPTFWNICENTVKVSVICVSAIVQYEREKVKTKTEDREHLYKLVAMKYKECMKDMTGRAPGKH